MTPLEAAHARHYLTERHKGFRLCADCLMSWPCDFQRQREETVRARADAERLADALRGLVHAVEVTSEAAWDAGRAALTAHEAGS